MAQSAQQVPLLRLVPALPQGSRTTVPTSTISDVELLAAARSGDDKLAAALHDRIRPTVDSTLMRLMGCRDTDHDDLAQRSIIEFFTTLHRYRGDCSLDSWVSTLTARVVYKDIRHRQVERRVFSGLDADGEEGSFPAAPIDLARQISMRNLLARVSEVLADMDQERAWAFLLHDVCGYDLREVASISSISVAAAQTRLSRGRRELHARLGADAELASVLEEFCGGRP
jgi:RNA polymerase sigma-70 factor, ECF subfamily